MIYIFLASQLCLPTFLEIVAINGSLDSTDVLDAGFSDEVWADILVRFL